MNVKTSFDSLLRESDPLISETLNRALDEKEISVSEATRLFYAKGLDFHLIGAVADELRKRRVGDIVTYVVNRNINFTKLSTKTRYTYEKQFFPTRKIFQDTSCINQNNFAKHEYPNSSKSLPRIIFVISISGNQ